MDIFEISVQFSDTLLTSEDRQVLRFAEQAKEKEDETRFVLEWLSKNDSAWKKSTERVAHYGRKARIEKERNDAAKKKEEEKRVKENDMLP